MKRIMSFILVSLIISVAFASSNEPFVDYHTGNFVGARDPMITLAGQNNPEAMYYLANMYLHGFGVKKDFGKGLSLLSQSAQLKYLPALLEMGKYYFFVKKNIAEALPWFKSAAEKDDLNAQLFVMIAYVYGYGTKKDEDKANWAMIQAAKKGNAMAQYELGHAFVTSKYKSNHDLGLIWLQKAADKGYPKAINALNHTDTQQANANEPAPNKISEYQLMWSALQEARATLSENKLLLVQDGEQMITPKLIPVTKNMIIQPDYSIMSPTEVPIAKISALMLRKNYFKQKPSLVFPKPPFIFPIGTHNYQEAFAYLQKHVTFGDPVVLYKLGLMYADGLGIKADGKKAIEYFFEAAKQNYVHAQYKIGISYLEGKAVEANSQEAIRWLTKAALRGSPQALFVLGIIYEYGINHPDQAGYIQRDIYQAKALYNISALHNVPEAQYRLAQLYASGVLNPNHDFVLEQKNQKMAYALYKLAVKNGMNNAKLGLAYFEAVYGKDPGQLKQVFDSLHAWVVQQDEGASLLVALLYDHGIGVAKNQEAAMDQYEQLATKGNPIAQFMVGTYKYLNAHDKEKATAWLLQAAAQNNPYAQYNLAILTIKNAYHPVNETFISLLEKSAQNNFSKAAILLADHYLMQNAGAYSIRDAVTIYQNLAGKQNSTAQLKLGYMYKHGIYFPQDEAKAFEYYSQAAKNKNPVAQYLLGMMYLTGSGTTQDITLAMHYFYVSAKANYTPAIVALGYTYEMVKGDYPHALVCYQHAASQNNPAALYNLAIMYKYGKAVKQDLPTAFNWFKKSANQNYAPAQVQIGNLYLQGAGVHRNTTEALNWYQKAAERKNSAAIYRLGLLHETGVGCDANLGKAKEFYIEAAALGNTQAQIALARLNKENPQEEIKYYQKTSALNIPFVQYRLSILTNKSALNNETENQQFCIHNTSQPPAKKSFLGKVENIFSSSLHEVYLSAIENLNNCRISQGIAVLQKIIKEKPDYAAAQKTLEYYLCPTQPVPSGATNEAMVAKRKL